MKDEVYKKYRFAGEIAKQVIKYAKKLVKIGASTYEICEKIESKIYELGGAPAFPCNISINEIAAHYTAPYEANLAMKIPENSIVKVDLGVHVDGFIVDTAVSMVFHPKYSLLAKAAEDALYRVIDRVKAGVKCAELGSIIERTIKEYGFNPIKNLSGHQIKRYKLHAGKVIPNVGSGIGTIRCDEVYAIEPFATTGVGYVRETKVVNIFALKGYTGRGKHAVFLDKLKTKFNSLPFTDRWLKADDFEINAHKILRKLAEKRVLNKFPVLVESSKASVSQAEHTIIVRLNSCEVLT